MTRTKMAVLWVLPIFAASTALADTPLMVNPNVNSHPGAPGGDNVNSAKNLKVRLINSCFAMNLRASTNPISPQSLVTASLQVEIRKTPDSTPTKRNLMVKFMGDLVTKQKLTAPDPELPKPEMYKVTDEAGNEIKGAVMTLYGNTLQVELPPESANLTLDGNGDVIPATVTVNKPSFEQHVLNCDDRTPVYGSLGYSTFQPTYACGAYMAKDGPLSYELKSVAVSANGASVEINVSFPGQTGFCGGYFSPLMVFFDDARPRFIGSSPFQLSSAGQTYWPEPDAPGHFLALDRDGNGKIDNKNELFGDQDNDKNNGFDALKELDSNKDGVVDAKDRKFAKLLLWNDKNGDGVSQPEELQGAAKAGIVKISLKYKRNHKSYGETAEARQASEFTFKKDGKTKKGMVEDIWFGPVPGSAGKK